MTKSRFLIAATHSGCGKTTFSLGLMRLLTQQGRKVQPFKCGPDYIDTQFHAVATGHPSINLDTFMSSEAHVREVFRRYDSPSDVSIVEGVMGLFDGYSKDLGSSAHIATLLDLPVVLLVNAASCAYSAAATLYGFTHFRPALRIAGVVFNRVASESHFRFLQEACEEVGVPCLGYIRKSPHLETPSRHLGLTLGAQEMMNTFIEQAAEAIQEHVDITQLLEKSQQRSTPYTVPTLPKRPVLRIAVARDEAFNFLYPENLEALKNHPRYEGRITYFSPLHDPQLPDADLVYLPGGYPELFAAELEQNTSMRHSIADFVERQGLLLGECGGMIYLTEELDGHRMCGVLPMKCTMDQAKLTLGYRRLTLGPLTFFGHEFHYSHLIDPHALPSIGEQYNVRQQAVDTPVYRIKNAIATYTHLYWGERDLLKLWNL